MQTENAKNDFVHLACKELAELVLCSIESAVKKSGFSSNIEVDFDNGRLKARRTIPQVAWDIRKIMRLIEEELSQYDTRTPEFYKSRLFCRRIYSTNYKDIYVDMRSLLTADHLSFWVD